MLRKLLILICLLSQAPADAQAPNTWVRRADIGTNFPGSPALRTSPASFSVGGKGYVCGGYGPYSGATLSDLWEYDTVVNTWTQKANFPGGSRLGAVGMSIGNKGYVATGYGTGLFSCYKDMWEYDPATNAWTQKADLGGVGRQLGVAFSIGNRGYITSGSTTSFNSFLKDLWEYNPTTNSWIQRDSMPGPARFKAVGFSAGGKGYIGTGTNVDSGQFRDLYEWNPATLLWTRKANMPSAARDEGVAFGIGNKGYVGLGEGAGFAQDFWEYNTNTDTWTQKADFGGVGRYSGFGFAIGPRGYAGLGYATSSAIPYPTDFWQFDTAANAWDRKTNFGGSTVRHSSFGFSVGEKSYVGSGSSQGGYLSDLWEYNAQTGAWSQKADFIGPGRARSVAFTIAGKGYVGTGTTGITGPLNDFYEYNPATNTWTQKADFPGVERQNAVAFSISGKGYIGTGYAPYSSNPNYLTKDLWEYNPATNTWTQKADFPGSWRSSASGFSINNKGYIGMGSTNGPNGGILQNDLWEYNPVTNAWTAKTALPAATRSGCVTFTVGNKGYIAAGAGGSWLLNELWEYNTYTGNWTQKASFSALPRTIAVSFAIGNKGYIGSGSNGSTLLEDFWEYTTDYALSTGTISNTSFCAGTTVNVPFTLNGSFFAGNIFTAQLSDANGSFASPVNIGTLADTNAGTVTAIIPPGTLSGNGYRIRVISSSPELFGTDNSINLAITGTVPVVSIAANPGNNVCAGIPVSFTAIVAGGGSSPSYVWKVNGSPVGTSPGYSSSSLNNNDQVSCTVTSSAACAVSPGTSASVVMTITPVLTPSITVTANPTGPVCAGTIVSYTASIANGGSIPSYTWKKNGVSVNTSSTYSYTPAAGDVILCELQSNFACASIATVSSTPLTMVVQPKPTATITSPSGAGFCAGDSAMLMAVTQPGYNYFWLLNNSIVSTNPSITIQNGGSYRLLVINSSSGCRDTSSALVMTVYPLPVPVISAAGNVMSTGVFASYQWYLNGVPISGATAISYTATQAGTYTVRVIDTHGCSGLSAPFTANVGVSLIMGSNGIRIFPNPVDDLLYIDAVGPVDMVLSDVTGREVLVKKEARHLEMGKLTAGIYFLQVRSRNQVQPALFRIAKR